jgi:hypothetical protein
MKHLRGALIDCHRQDRIGEVERLNFLGCYPKKAFVGNCPAGNRTACPENAGCPSASEGSRTPVVVAYRIFWENWMEKQVPGSS